MTVGGGLTVDRTQQIKVLDHAEWAQVEDLADRVSNAFLGHRRCPEGVDVQANRASAADRVCKLNLATLGDTRGHDVLGDPTGSIRRGTVNLRRIFSGECAASVAGHATVGIDDNLATGEASVSGGTTQDEAS